MILEVEKSKGILTSLERAIILHHNIVEGKGTHMQKRKQKRADSVL
jgi:hypothetical protein